MVMTSFECNIIRWYPMVDIPWWIPNSHVVIKKTFIMLYFLLLLCVLPWSHEGWFTNNAKVVITFFYYVIFCIVIVYRVWSHGPMRVDLLTFRKLLLKEIIIYITVFYCYCICYYNSAYVCLCLMVISKYQLLFVIQYYSNHDVEILL